MILTDKWEDYEVLDTGNGMKLERWGNVILERPDPQVIWPAEKWQGQDAIYHRSKKGGGQWQFIKKIPESWEISYPSAAGPLRFKVQPTGFKHTGLFPEQGANWDYIAEHVMRAKEDGLEARVLNLFAYTGGATVAAAKAGADETVHVDASKGMNSWAKENAELSGLKDSYIRYLVDDVQKFVAREQRRGRKYMGIIMDPPSYGRGPGGEVWQLEETLWDLVSETAKLLDLGNPHAFFILNSYTTGLSPVVSENMLRLALGDWGRVSADDLCLPCTARPLVLPCGSTARWEL